MSPTRPPSVPQPSPLEILIERQRAEFIAAGFSDEDIRAALELLISAADDEPNRDARGVLNAQSQPAK